MNRSVMNSRLALLFALVFAWSGCGQGNDVSETDDGQLVVGRTEERAVVERGIAPGGRTLVLRGFSGSIRLSGTTGDYASLTFEKTARADQAADARALLDRIQIDETGAETEYRYVMQSSEPTRTAVNVRGTVPAGTALRIELQNGAIELSGVTGPITVDSDNGHVAVGGAGGNVAVTIRNGNLDVGMQALPPDTRVDLETSNGNVTFTLPADAAARVTAETQAGSIQAEGALTFTSRDLDPQGAGARFTGQLGRGNAVVELTTRNGSITLAEGRVLTLPSFDEGEPAAPAAPGIDTTAADSTARDTTLQRLPAPAPRLPADTSRTR